MTGYGPFLNNKTNPTEDLVTELNGTSAGDYKIFGRVLPVSFRNTPLELSKRLLETRPDAVLCLGLAADRTEVTPELVAINYFHSKEADNDGEIVKETKLYAEGPPAYFSSVPARAIADAICQKGVPARVSTTAGTFVCNQTMYELGKRFEKSERKIPWGFIHVPGNLSKDQLKTAVTTAIELL